MIPYLITDGVKKGDIIMYYIGNSAVCVSSM